MASLRLARAPVALLPRAAPLGSTPLRIPRTCQISPSFYFALSRRYASNSFPPHTVITMPALSPTMQSGNIGAWQKKAGDSLTPGDVLVEVETDKAQMDFEFQDDGVLAKILKESGEKDVAVGTPIAVMVQEGDDIVPFESFSLDDAGGEKAPPKQQKESGSKESSEPEGASAQSENAASTEQSRSSETQAPRAKESESSGERLQPSIDRENAAPAVKKLALEKGVPINQVKGTGPGGRVTKADVEEYKPVGPTAAPTAASTAAGGSYEDQPISSMRKTIASRLQQSMNDNPHYFVSTPMSVTKLIKLRAALNASANGKYRLSMNDFLIKAVASAARKVPAVNSSWREVGSQTVIRKHHYVDVSVAVATPVGLLTPIVKGADSLGLESISSQVKDLGGRARDGKLKPEEYQGGTITISNMGMNPAVERFTAVINPPQAAIIAVGTVRKVAIPSSEVEDGEAVGVEWDDQIVIQGSFDHKVVDGAVGGEFMRELKKVVENPLELLL